jgi:hypothetical protein
MCVLLTDWTPGRASDAGLGKKKAIRMRRRGVAPHYGTEERPKLGALGQPPMTCSWLPSSNGMALVAASQERRVLFPVDEILRGEGTAWFVPWGSAHPDLQPPLLILGVASLDCTHAHAGYPAIVARGGLSLTASWLVRARPTPSRTSVSSLVVFLVHAGNRTDSHWLPHHPPFCLACPSDASR